MSTIKTFGRVNERSHKQLMRCMSAGDAEFGVLRAHHHPGYSRPIRVGIAYEGYVSPVTFFFDGSPSKKARTEFDRSSTLLSPRRPRR